MKMIGGAIGVAMLVTGCNAGEAPTGAISASVGSQFASGSLSPEASISASVGTASLRPATYSQIGAGSATMSAGLTRASAGDREPEPPAGLDGWVASDFFGGDPELDVGAPEAGTHWGDLLAEAGGITCPGAACPTDDWAAIVEEGRTLPLRDRVILANRFIRRTIRYQEDPEHRQRLDDWNTPSRSVALGRGDCEDFAVAQYFLLRAMGTPTRLMRLVRTDEPGPLDHIALAISFAERIVVMDYDGLWGPERYGPLIGSMNENRVWAHANPFDRDAGDRPVARIAP